MAQPATKVIIVAQAEVTQTPAQGADAHAPETGVTIVEQQLVEGELHDAGLETHASTEAHGDAHSTVFPPFDPAHFGSQLVWLALTFVFLYVVMSRVALPRIGGILESRRARIDGDLKEADRLRQETERAVESYEAALAEARANAHAIAEETRAGIKADIDMKRASVEAELSKKVADAEARIAATKTAALGNVDNIATDTLPALMERLVGPVSAEEARDAVAAASGERS
jgi:F-type H+-transporting ATPase subunit b